MASSPKMKNKRSTKSHIIGDVKGRAGCGANGSYRTMISTATTTTISQNIYTGVTVATLRNVYSHQEGNVSGDCVIMSPPLSASATDNFRVPNCDMKSYASYPYEEFGSAGMPMADYSPGYEIETPNSMYAECQGSPLCFEDDEGNVLLTQPEQPQYAHFAKEDVFRFDPEDIARLTDTGAFENPLESQSSYTPYSPYTPFTPNHVGRPVEVEMSHFSANYGRGSDPTPLGPNANFTNPGIEYYNYDEINCQSKNQSPCSSPPLDPWFTMKLDEMAAGERRNSPKLNNLSYEYDQYVSLDMLKQESRQSATICYEKEAEECEMNNKLPSMMSTFGTPKCEPVNNYAQQYRQEQYAVSYDHPPENYHTNQRDFEKKPNRERKLLWTDDDDVNELMPELHLKEPIQQPPQSQRLQEKLQKNLQLKTRSMRSLTEEATKLDLRDKDLQQFNKITQKSLHSRSNNSYANDDDDNVPPGGYKDDGGDGCEDPVFTGDNRSMRYRNNSHSSCHSAASLSSNTNEDRPALVNAKTSTTSLTETEKLKDKISVDQFESMAEPQVCRWTDCNEEFKSQGDFVGHIEKRHVDVKKGEDFSCLWKECPRRNRPFNARYKLLIHMRVHSGEKPNKCPLKPRYI